MGWLLDAGRVQGARQLCASASASTLCSSKPTIQHKQGGQEGQGRRKTKERGREGNLQSGGPAATGEDEGKLLRRRHGKRKASSGKGERVKGRVGEGGESEREVGLWYVGVGRVEGGVVGRSEGEATVGRWRWVKA
ncbi:unnamed protein product [Linum trigynum]|uniref:Uncharacterized protein n=1 Tax=Linum trigynum TaxID=586398 RepID=A0AAV2EAR9_9ROSI